MEGKIRSIINVLEEQKLDWVKKKENKKEQIVSEILNLLWVMLKVIKGKTKEEIEELILGTSSVLDRREDMTMYLKKYCNKDLWIVYLKTVSLYCKKYVEVVKGCGKN